MEVSDKEESSLFIGKNFQIILTLFNTKSKLISIFYVISYIGKFFNSFSC